MIGSESGTQYETEFDAVIDSYQRANIQKDMSIPLDMTNITEVESLQKNKDSNDYGQVNRKFKEQGNTAVDPSQDLFEHRWYKPPEMSIEETEAYENWMSKIPKILRNKRYSLDPMPNIPSPPIVPKEWPPHPINPTRVSDASPDPVEAGQQTAMLRQRPGLLQDPLSAEVEQNATGFNPGRGGALSISQQGVQSFREQTTREARSATDRGMAAVDRAIEQLKDHAKVAPKATSFSLERTGDRQGYRNHSFNVNDLEGKPATTLNISERRGGKELHVEWIGMDLTGRGPMIRSNPNQLGHKAMKDVLRALKEEFPNAETIQGYRVSGARSNTGKGAAEAVIRIRPPKEIDLEEGDFVKFTQ